MKVLFKIASVLFSLSLLLSGCEKEPDAPEATGLPQGFPELIQAYKDGKVFLSAEHQGGDCTVTFTDGYRLTVPETSFEIHDCTEKEPAKVSFTGSWWMLDGVVTAIRVDTSLTIAESLPVYVYFDARTLYIYLSNRSILTFPSKALEDEKLEQEEIERRQRIPVVRITTKNSAPILDKKNYVDGTIKISDPEKKYSDVTEFTADMGIRGRGNSTWGWPKKPWKVKLDEKASLLGMPADKEWCLLANYSDRTLLRNLTAMKLSEICGFSWTPRMHSVEVYLNNEYQGVYTLAEHKKISPDRVNIDVADEGDESDEAITGGYYLEMEENMDETTCWKTGMGVPMMFSDPEIPTDRQLAYVKGYFEDFEDALMSGGDFFQYIDVESFIHFYIVQELTKNIDGNIRKSCFITKERGKKMEMYHLWDFDLTLGNCGYFLGAVGNGPDNFWIKDYGPDCWTYGSGWYYRMFENPDFVDALIKRWDELFPHLEAIPDFIREQALILGKAQERNFKVWSIWESVDWVKFPSLGSYEKEVDYLIEFYTDRLHWLDRELKKL